MSPSKDGGRTPSPGRGRHRAAAGPAHRPDTRKRGAAPSRGRKPARRVEGRTLGLRAAKWAAVALIWAVVIGAGFLAVLAWDLPAIDGLDPDVRRTRDPGVTILASDDSLVAGYGDLYGRRLGVNELPAPLVQAVIAIEDRRFFEHPGVDWRGILRAFLANLREGGIVQGGSTLTQQLAKNLFLTPERALSRKLREAMLALALEHRFEKDEILTIYLNRVYLGAGTFGVEAAAQRYFGKSAREIDTYQAAVLAGLLRAPSRLNPEASEQAAHQRALTVLDAMVVAGFLREDTAARIARTSRPGRGDDAAPRPVVSGQNRRYFADWALAHAQGYAGRSRASLEVDTTLDPHLQALAEKAVSAAVPDGAEVALVAMSPDGAVRAMVGGRDYTRSQFNRATDALRQPGSAFKPIVYLPALEAGMTPDTPVLDAPIAVEGWAPRNYTREYRGDVTLREALARSLNSVAVRVSEDIGRDHVIHAARRLGLTARLSPHPSIALGAGEVTPLELTAAYAVFANGGMAVEPYGVVEVRSMGEVVLRRDSGLGRRIVEPHTAAAMTDMLRAVVDWGTGRGARIAVTAAGKTGTSQDFRDAWFVGFTGDLVTGVWVGRDDNAPMDGINGSGAPAQIWAAFMGAAAERGVRIGTAAPQASASGPPGASSPAERRRSFEDILREQLN